jgi:hypothetical protein
MRVMRVISSQRGFFISFTGLLALSYYTPKNIFL